MSLQQEGRHLRSRTWAVIPARGGSVAVPRKNLRIVAGRPLIVHSIASASQVVPHAQVVVITDDDEIAGVASRAGATVILEQEPTPPTETLDTKIVRNLPRLRELGAQQDDLILTIQPTSPLLSVGALERAVAAFEEHAVKSVLTVTEDRHLRWAIDGAGRSYPLYAARVNRQQLPLEYRETGGIIGARLADIQRHESRVVAPTHLIVLDEEEAIDIDSFADLYAAAHLSTRLKIAIRVDAAHHLGMGHVYRAFAIATELARHDVRIYTSVRMPLGRDFFSRLPYHCIEVDDEIDFIDQLADFAPDMVVLDVLDTTIEFVEGIRDAARGTRIVTFEDLGAGATVADLLVAEFVSHERVSADRQLQGVRNAILSPAFEQAEVSPYREQVEHVLVLFGGTDPSSLAERSLDALERVGFDGTVTVVRGLGATAIDTRRRRLAVRNLTDVKDMPTVMREADIALTSAGRTIIELATVGTPSICIAQNDKEMQHTHATAENGVCMLGLGAHVRDQEIDTALTRLINDSEYRARLRAHALTAVSGRSNHRTLGRVFDLLGFDPFPNL